MAEHFGYAFYGHSVAEGDGGSEGVTCNVKGEVFFPMLKPLFILILKMATRCTGILLE